jgi:hypothetical protein
MKTESLFMNCKHCGKSIRKSSTKCPKCGGKITRLSFIHWIGLVSFALLTLILIKSPTNQPNSNSQIKTPQEIKNIIKNSIELSYSWNKSSFGTIMEADFKIKNNSNADIKDIEIQCDHYSKSETKIDENSRTIYEIFSSKTERSFSKYNMGFIHDQVASSNCYVKNFSIIDQK